MRVPSALTALVLSSGVLLAAPGIASAQDPLVAARFPEQVGPAVPPPAAPDRPAPAPPSPPTDPNRPPVGDPPGLRPDPPAPPTPEPPTVDAPAVPDPPGTVMPEPDPAPVAPSPSSPVAEPTPAGPLPADPVSPAPPAEQPVEQPVEPPVDQSEAAAVPAAPVVPATQPDTGLGGGHQAPPPAARTSDPFSGSVRTAPAGAAPEQSQTEEAVAAGEVPPSAGPPLRYVAAGILSIVAVALALGIAVVSQPRRSRRTH